MAEKTSSKKISPFDSKKLIVGWAVALIVLIIVFIFLNFGNESDFLRPEGVEPIDSAHAHAKLMIILDKNELGIAASKLHTEYVNTNLYVFLDHDNFLHRVATEATLGMLLESWGMQFTDECFIIPENTYDTQRNLIERTEFCNDGQMKIKLYVWQNLVEDNADYVFVNQDKLLIIYDDDNDSYRDFVPYFSRGFFAGQQYGSGSALHP